MGINYGHILIVLYFSAIGKKIEIKLVFYRKRYSRKKYYMRRLVSFALQWISINIIIFLPVLSWQNLGTFHKFPFVEIKIDKFYGNFIFCGNQNR